MSNNSDKEIIFSKPSSTTTVNSINDIRKNQVVDLKQVIKKPVLAVPPMPFNLQEPKPLKHFRTYEPIHSNFPNSKSFNSLDFSLVTKNVKAKKKVAQVRPFNKTSLDNQVKEIKSIIHKNSSMNINWKNYSSQQDTNLNRSSKYLINSKMYRTGSRSKISVNLKLFIFYESSSVFRKNK